MSPGSPTMSGDTRVQPTRNCTCPCQRLVDKIENARDEMADYDIINPDAEKVFIAYGAPVRTVQQVMHDTKDKNIGFLRIRTVWPFPGKGTRRIQKCPAFLCSGDEPRPDRPRDRAACEGAGHQHPETGRRPPHACGTGRSTGGGRMSYEDWFRQDRLPTSTVPAAGTGRSSTVRLPQSTRWAGKRRRRSLSPVSAVHHGPPAISSPTRSTPPTAGRLRLQPGSRWQTRIPCRRLYR